MEEETDWSQISPSDQRSYIKIETLRGKTQPKFIMLYVKFVGIVQRIVALCRGGHLVSVKVG
jgi:hypothetical protein